MSELLPAVLFCAAVLLLLFGAPWWSLRRAMRREGIVPCLNVLENQLDHIWFVVGTVALFVLVGAVLVAWRSETALLVNFGLFVLAACPMIGAAVVMYLLPAAWELNRALTQMIRSGTPPPERSAEVIRLCLARTHWLQAPLFRLRGVTRQQVEQWLAATE